MLCDAVGCLGAMVNREIAMLEAQAQAQAQAQARVKTTQTQSQTQSHNQQGKPSSSSSASSSTTNSPARKKNESSLTLGARGFDLGEYPLPPSLIPPHPRSLCL